MATNSKQNGKSRTENSNKTTVFIRKSNTNTLILARTTFLSNVFPIPEQILKKIYKILFNYLWYNKPQEPIARKTLFLPKHKGGLNITEPEAHNLSKRIKHLLNDQG